MKIIGTEAIADVCGVVPKTVFDWLQAGMPVLERGGPGRPSTYATEDVIAWLIERAVAPLRGGESPKDRLDRLRADEVEMRLAEATRTLIPAAEIEPAWRGAITTARERLRSEPARLAAAMDGLDAGAREAALRTLFDEVLVALAELRDEGDVDDAVA